MRQFIEVSPEMTLLLGEGAFDDAPMPPDPLALCFDADAATPTLEVLPIDELGGPLVLVIQRSAFARVGGSIPEAPAAFHLPCALRAIAQAIAHSDLQGETLSVYRLGKSIELLCETIRAINAGDLAPLAGDCALSLEDARRIAAARRLIDDRWNEKLTLDRIARACGLNRAKLTRGFRQMFHCTIAEAIAERRLHQASLMLRTTDLPVSSIGYESGYLNNASFARAFARRFGVSPSGFRACQMSAA